MKDVIFKIDNYLFEIKNKYKFIMILFVISILITIALNICTEIFNYKLENPHFKEENSIIQFLTIVIFVPILETLIFQLGVIKLVLYFVIHKKVAVFISASLFALSHPYGVVYIIYTLIIGLYFFYIYFLTLRKNTSPFLTIFFVHALFNLICYISNFQIINQLP